MGVFSACMYMCLVLGRPEEGAGSPGTGVTNSCGPSCGYWVLNPGFLEEHLVVSTAEPYLQTAFS